MKFLKLKYIYFILLFTFLFFVVLYHLINAKKIKKKIGAKY